MKWIIIFSVLVSMYEEIVVFDKSNSLQWSVINDTVMGGVSNSSVFINKEKQLVFEGEVSTKNNGGFAMVKTLTNVRFTERNQYVVVKLKGDGKQYQLRLKSNKNQKYWYIHSFKTSEGVQEIALRLVDFYPSFRGEKLRINNFSEHQIEEVAVLIGNKKNEKFTLCIEKITIQ